MTRLMQFCTAAVSANAMAAVVFPPPVGTLYVTLEPCPMCAGATVNARVDRIVFGTEDEAMGACGTAVSVTSLKNAFKPELYRGLLCEECTAILRRFFKARRAERTEK